MSYGLERKRPGPTPGQPYFKPALRRALERAREKLDKACDKLLADAAGETEVVGPKGMVYEISPKDRRQAFECIRDTLDGRPDQALDLGAMPSGNVYILNAAPGTDIAFPLEIDRALQLELTSGDKAEPVDLDDIQTNGHVEDDEEV